VNAKDFSPTQILAPNPAGSASASPTPQPIAPADVQWNCKTSPINSKGEGDTTSLENLTVGTKFYLICEGAPLALAKDKLSLELPKETQYALRLLETRSLSDTKGEFIATTWMAGELKLTNPILTDGTKRIGLGEMSLNVTSVIDPKTNPESKPYSPWTVLALAWPLWIWGFLLMVLFAAALAFGLRFRSSTRRKRLLKMLEKNAIAMSPYHQFNKDLRKLSREIPSDTAGWTLQSEKDLFRNLDEALRWYLARTLVIQTFDRRPNEIVRDLKRVSHRLQSELKRDLVITLSEVEKAAGSQKRTTIDDALQILELTRGLADRVHKAQEGK
jgi:hypothetical protein